MSGRRQTYDGWSGEDQELMREIGRRSRAFRTHEGWSLKVLAEEAELNESFLGELERGRVNVSVRVLARLCGALGVGLVDVLQAP
jgi:transcriptional regulator with XRE-family HTH domain